MEENFNDFLVGFRVKFIDFFSSQCSSSDCTLHVDRTKRAAGEILDNLFAKKIEFSKSTNELILQMKRDEVFIGILLSKVFLYTIENYIIYLQNAQHQDFGYLEKLTQVLSRFLHLFEIYTKENFSNNSSIVNFDENNYIYSKNNILDTFRELKIESKSVDFMNLHYGYPIRSKGKVLEIDGENVEFQLESELQEIAMKLEGKAYILKGEHFNRYIKADIVYSNFANNTIVLNNFVYLLNLPAAQRRHPRIYPKILIHAKLMGKENESVTGNLYDLSKDGLGMISEENQGFYNGAKINIKFEVENDSEKYSIVTTGEVVDIAQYMKSYRYCLKIYPDEENQKKIEKYIRDREEEIRQELKDELNYYLL